MSIFIDGMEMPTDGHWGTVSIPFYIHGDGSVSDSKGHIIGSAVPVPPHGRLIDADALRQDWLENGENDYVYDTNSFLYSLDDAPTIIPAEEGET